MLLARPAKWPTASGWRSKVVAAGYFVWDMQLSLRKGKRDGGFDVRNEMGKGYGVPGNELSACGQRTMFRGIM